MIEDFTHRPVLLNEVMDLVRPVPGETCIDCTFGSGGHSRELASRIGTTGTLIAIDRDREAEEPFRKFANGALPQVRFMHEGFDRALESLAGEGVVADVILLDLGVSSPQIDVAERGFSYVCDAPLDMRMDRDQPLTADTVVNSWSMEELASIISDYGEERHARGIARAVVARRPIGSTSELVEAVQGGMPPAARFGRGHPAKRTFQAIRIAVNDEIGAVERALPAAWNLLATGGRLAVISFHSLEDRRVKRYFAGLAQACTCPPEFPVCVCGKEPEARLLTRRAVKAGESEQAENPRSASARLRVAEKIPHQSRHQGGEG